MKTLLLLLTLFSLTAQATNVSVCTQGNQAGGSINLTLEKSTRAKDSLFGYMTTASGHYMTFDYQLIDNNVLARYEDGSKMLYPLNSFDCSALQRMKN